MEITKINSENSQITKISQGIKNPNRANIFINDKFDFSLDIAQLADAKLKIGQTLSKNELLELRSLSNFGKLYQRSLEWALMRPRSTKEVRDYLIRKKAEKEDIENIIERLTSKGYLDDRAFAKYFLENRFIKKGISKKRLSLELRKKGVTQGIIEESLADNSRSDEEEIQKIIAKKRNKYDDDHLIAYLTRQGFDYQTARTQVLGTD